MVRSPPLGLAAAAVFSFGVWAALIAVLAAVSRARRATSTGGRRDRHA